MNYFIQVDGESHGPISAEQLRLRIAEKGLTNSDFVRREDSAEWMTVGALEEFRNVAAPLLQLGNPLAYWSLALAVGSPLTLFLSVFFDLFRVPEMLLVVWCMGLLAVVLGHLALRRTSGRGVARGGLWLGYFITLAPIILAISFPPGSHISERSPMTRAISNCRQIITTLRLYSSDHNGKYPDAALPDARSSNEVFRLMFVDGQADNENIFGCPSSQVGNPDGNIGTAPDFHEAVAPGENHWSMTKGLTDSSDGSIPLVFENPTDATWPPKWSPELDGTGKPGRSWKGGKVIIGFNDGSIVMEPLESNKGERVGLKPKADGKPVFPDLDPKPTILQVESR